MSDSLSEEIIKKIILNEIMVYVTSDNTIPMKLYTLKTFLPSELRSNTEFLLK